APLQRAQKYKNEGNVCFKMKKFEEAIAQYNKAIEICPKENKDELAIFYQNRAAAYEQLKKYSSVKADCTKALELNPKYIKALLRRARVLEQTGDLEAALKDIHIACIHERFSNFISVLKEQTILEKIGRQHAEENWRNRKLFIRIISKPLVKMYILCFPKDPVFSKLQCPENISEFLKKPLKALKNEEYSDIISLCTEIIESPEFDTLTSTKLEVLLLRATFYALLDEHDPAIQDFDCILNSEYVSDDVKINVLIKRAHLNYMNMNLAIAFMDVQLAISINPHYSDIYYHRGLLYISCGKLNEAKCDFEKALEYNPNFSMACIHKCYIDYRIAMLNKDVRLVEATVTAFEKIFEKCTNLPECTFYYLFCCKMMSETRQYQKAHIYFTKIIKKYPKDISIIALVYQQRGILQLHWDCNLDKAMKYFNKAIELDKNCSGTYEALGVLELRRRNIEEAVRLFDKSLVYCHEFKKLLRVYCFRELATVELKVKNQFTHSYSFNPNLDLLLYKYLEETEDYSKCVLS
ncbi:Mitochondrial import receptor subunit TOM70, partial [Cyphomyrmex costatus]